MNNLKTKKATPCSKNIITSIIAPALVFVVALIVGFFAGFSKGLDFKGGVLVSINAQSYNLTDEKEYATFKNKVDLVLNENNVEGYIYSVEKDSITYDDVLVVKIDVSSYKGNKTALVETLKNDIISEFYSDVELNQIELRNLVSVSTFKDVVDMWSLISTILASLVALLLVCIYVGFRVDFHTSILCLLSAPIAIALSFSLIMLTRVKLYQTVLSVIPMITILASILTFVFAKKTNKLLKSGAYVRKSNYVLADDAVETFKNGLIKFAIILLAGLALVGILNIANPVLFFALSIIEALIATVYTVLFIIPALFGLTFVRKVKREKVKKEQKEDKLVEADVLKETDLDNLVSN